MKNFTIQLTGLSATGKTTVSRHLKQELLTYPIEIIDGDEYRDKYKYKLGFSLKDRLTNINSIAILANTLNSQGINVIVSSISPYLDMRKYCRELIEKESNFFQVKCICDFSIRIIREIDNKKGIVSIENDIYEDDNDSDIIIDTGVHSPETCVTNIKIGMMNKQFLKANNIFI